MFKYLLSRNHPAGNIRTQVSDRPVLVISRFGISNGINAFKPFFNGSYVSWEVYRLEILLPVIHRCRVALKREISAGLFIRCLWLTPLLTR